MPGLQLMEPSGDIAVAPGSVNTVPARLEAPADQASGVHRIVMTLTAVDGSRVVVHESTRFIGPAP
jgi:hypothetical protein